MIEKSNHPIGVYEVETGDPLEYDLARSAFLASFEGDYFTFGIRRAVNDSFANVIDLVAKAIWEVVDSRPRIYGRNRAMAYLEVERKVLLKIESEGHPHQDIWTSCYRPLFISGFGSRDHVTALRAKIEAVKDQTSHLPRIDWHYLTKHGRMKHSFQFQRPKPSHDAFYPFIPCGLTNYFDRFIESDENILVLLGETGTGKTTFLRNLIWYTSWDAAFTYDEQLLATDDMFVDFLTSSTELLIVEDADLFLTNREHDGNRMMARFLNVSDGLLRTGDTKKIVFTANLTQPQRIDNALLREGRCFDCLMFRPFTYDEAIKAATAAKISLPEEERDYTLAQLFAKQRRVLPSLGFGNR